jgi:hypothetical protein
VEGMTMYAYVEVYFHSLRLPLVDAHGGMVARARRASYFLGKSHCTVMDRVSLSSA